MFLSRTLSLRFWILLLCSLLLLPSPASAQMNTGEIGGAVSDMTGASVPDATGIAEQSGTGQRFTAKTDQSGEDLLPQLPVGAYRLTIDAAGFKQSGLSEIAVH